MRYGDDQCVECGGIRVAKSKLCANCLVKQLDRERRKKRVLQSIIDNRDLEIAKLDKRLCGAVDYGFKQNQENAKLQYHIRKLEELTTRRP